MVKVAKITFNMRWSVHAIILCLKSCIWEVEPNQSNALQSQAN